MNVFEDLVVELKEENLLETIVTTTPQNGHDKAADDIHTTEEPVTSAELAVDDAEAPEVTEAAHAEEPRAEVAAKVRHGREFFNKRAVGEVSSLQMVEHVLTGVEREYMKVIPKVFDDFNAKKALNAFLQVTGDANSEDHKKAEFDLMQETETWCSALAARDAKIPVSSLRLYCENSRPALSSQALLALGRFYRNSPYSETVRAKFDFVITRLFSRASQEDRRVCLFEREEMLEHVNRLYAEWSSVPLYTADSDESNVLLTALSFEDLALEIENASTFDNLIANDFFGRLRLFKESISELFYAPQVTAAAIDCNIRIGNAYVSLIEREHAKLGEQSIESRYAELTDDHVSDATAWTLDIVEIIRQRVAEAAENEKNTPQPPKIHVPLVERSPVTVENDPADAGAGLVGRLRGQLRSVNRWVLVSAAALLAASGALVVWASYFAEGESVSTSNVKALDESAGLGEHVKTAKVSSDTLYCLLQPSWDLQSKEKRTEVLQKALQIAQQQGAKQVQFINKDGKQAGFASAARLDVVMP